MGKIIRGAFCLVAVLAGGILLTSAAWCAEFAADVAVDQNGAKYSGTAYVKGGNVRYELMTGAGGKVIIYPAGFGAQWTIFPQQGVYDEEWDGDDDNFIVPEVDPRLIETASDESLGTETIAGFLCDIHFYSYDNPSRGTLTVYRARELDYPIKIELKKGYYYLTKEYRNIRMTRLDDSLFELPKGYSMLK
jgi:hypothetical protein